MANPKIRIISASATDRLLNIRVALFDDTGKMLTDKITDALESDGAHTEDQLTEFAKREAICYLKRLALQQNLIEAKLKNLPEEIEITEADLAKLNPRQITEK